MKKRKPPFVLLSLFFVALAVALVMSNKMFQISGNMPDTPEKHQPDEPSQAPDAATLAKAATEGAKVVTPAKKKGNGLPQGPDMSTILVQDYNKEKPKPLPSTTQSLRVENN